MEIQLKNCINNTNIIIYVNSHDKVIDIKRLIASSFPPEDKINESNIRLSYENKNIGHTNYMLSPFRKILSYEGLNKSRIIKVEKVGIQLDSAVAIILENILPILTFYHLYKDDFYYTKLLIHRIIFLLTCFYFICRLFICLKCYNNGKYFLTKLIFNLFLYWFLYSIICGNSIFNNSLDDMSIYSYIFTIVFIFCGILCLKLVKEYKDNEIKNILFNYVKYPYYTVDCFIWISMMIIIYNKRIIFFTIIKIIYNIYLAFEEFIEEKGLLETSSNYFSQDNFQLNRTSEKVIIPFIL